MKISPPIPPGMSPAPEHGLFNPHERKRMRWMLFGLGLVIVTLIVAFQKFKEAQREEAEQAHASEHQQPGVETVVVTPKIDVPELESLARDATPGERSLIDPAALAKGLGYARLVSDALFEPMHGRELDEKAAAGLVADPSTGRGSLFRAHGWIDWSERYPAAGEVPAHARLRLRLEDGGYAWFAVLEEPERGLFVDDFVRLDGIFVEDYRAEGSTAGEFVDAPLLAAPRLVRSYPHLTPVTELDPEVFAEVSDDSLEHGITYQPFYPYWDLVSYVRNLPPGAVDWTKAPLLDRDGMKALQADGARFRAQPIRIPVCQVMDSWTQAQKDNPLRIDKLTEGWLGSESWFGPANGVIRYVSPFVFENVHRHDEVVANGFFLKHLAYEPSKGGIAISPFFVLQSIEVHTTAKETIFLRLMWSFAAGIAVLGALIFLLVRRDRRRTSELQEELLQRRRARRRAQVTS